MAMFTAGEVELAQQHAVQVTSTLTPTPSLTLTNPDPDFILP